MDLLRRGEAASKQLQKLKDGYCRSQGVKQKSEKMPEKDGLSTLITSCPVGQQRNALPEKKSQ